MSLFSETISSVLTQEIKNVVSDETSMPFESQPPATPEHHAAHSLHSDESSSSTLRVSPYQQLFLNKHLGTGIVFDKRLLAHENMLSHHPECPSRLIAIEKTLMEEGLLDLVVKIQARPATDPEIHAAHEKNYVSWLETLKEKEPTEYERESIYYNTYTPECARLAAGGALDLASKIVSGELVNGFAIVRPPGHHAECNRAYGFCFLNNVSIVAKTLKNQFGMKRILIVDWDVHHGNGTQSIFFDDPSILYISIHRYDDGEFFPSSIDGDMAMVGVGAGKGYNVNIPFSNEIMGNAEYISAFYRIILPIATEFSPEFVLVSAGFDAALGDPIGGYSVTPECYGHLTHHLMSLAKGKIMLLLEGGYSLEVLPQCVSASLRALLGIALPPLTIDQTPDPSAMHTLDAVVALQSRFWKLLAPGHHKLVKPANGNISPTTRSRMLSMRVGLKDIFCSYWSSTLSNSFGMLQLPIPKNILLDGLIFMSSNVINTHAPVIVFVHNIPALRLGLPTLQNEHVSLHFSRYISESDSFIVGEMAYIERSFMESHSVIDILLTADGHPITPPHADSSQVLVDALGRLSIPSARNVNPIYSSLFYLWDSFLSLDTSKRVFLVGSSELAISSIIQLVSKRQVAKAIKGVILFPHDGPGMPVASQCSEWFMGHSRVYVNSTEPMGTKIPFSRVYGTCVSNGILEEIDLDSHSMDDLVTSFAMASVVNHAFKWIKKKTTPKKRTEL